MRILPFMKPKKGVTIAGVDYNDDSGGGGGGGYTLPTATATRLGGVKVGSGLSVESDGTLSASGGGGGTYDYSTTEFSTGQKWIDGKDIYGVVLYTTSLSGTEKSFSVTLGYDTVVDVVGGLRITSSKRCMPLYYKDGSDFFNAQVTTNSVTATWGGNVSAKDYLFIIVYYTKSTT